MSDSEPYSTHHPRWYRRPVSTYWWATRRSYFAFILRELSSIFVAWCLLYLLLFVRALRHGEAAYRHFLDLAAHPVVIFINVVTLAFIVFHAITWFNLAPQAMVVKVGHWRVPGVLIAASNYAAWALVSVVLAWLLMGTQMAYKRPIEPFLWLLFSAGGTLAAMVLPVAVALLALAFPLGAIEPPSYDYMHRLVGNPIARVALFALCTLGLLHWAHRFRYTLYDGLQIKHLNEMIDSVCYGGALVGSLVAAYLLLTF